MSENESYNCFGCSPANNHGLHLQFWLDGNEIITKWHPEKRYEGWAGILHGGIQATLMDEVAAWVVFVCVKTAGLTIEMNTRFLKPVYINKGPITIKATLLSFEKRVAKIACSLEDGKGHLCATSEVSYYCLPEPVARKKYSYPGSHAFLEENEQSSASAF